MSDGTKATTPLLRARNLSLALPDFGRKPAFGRPPLTEILKGIDLDLAPGEALGIVGESGSGKTSLGRTLVRLYKPTGGSLQFEGRDIADLDEAAIRPLRPRFQMVFQDPQSSLNPRRRVGEIVAQPLKVYGRVQGRAETGDRVAALLEKVALDPALAERYPHELSGGQRQRIGIARAIALDPALVIADEIVSGLDVSSQAQILSLLRDLRTDMGLALIFISHDLSVVRTVCDRVMVMLGGAVVESGACADIFARPRHAYTRKLLAAIPLPEVDPDWVAAAEVGDESEELIGTVERENGKMKIAGSVALVTGANRGVGAAFIQALKDRGAAKIYAAVRDPALLEDKSGVEIVTLDVTNPNQVTEVAEKCADVTLLINNAGLNHNRPLLGPDALPNAREEIEVNYFGTLAMCNAFAPVLGANGGGAIVNMLSILSNVNLPALGTYAASKAATLSLTQGVRAQLAAQGTAVVGVMPGSIDTRMTPGGEEQPGPVANAALDAVEAGDEDIYPGGMAQGVAQGLATDRKAVEKEFAQYLPE